MKLERNLAIEDYKKFTLDQLAEANTVEMLILKGHILVEYGMNLYLESISHNDDSDFSKENFTFAQKLTIVKHFSKIGIRNDSILPEVYLLNKLRNQIAHTLTFEKKQLEQLFILISKKFPEIDNPKPPYNHELVKLNAALGFICAAFFSSYTFTIERTKDLKSKSE